MKKVIGLVVALGLSTVAATQASALLMPRSWGQLANQVIGVVFDTRQPGRFTVFKAANGQFYFNLKSANNKIILQSEGYVAKEGALNGIASIRRNVIQQENILKAANGKFYFVWVAGNNRITGQSQMYKTPAGAKNGAAAVRSVAFNKGTQVVVK
jgi:uncharacterized protein